MTSPQRPSGYPRKRARTRRQLIVASMDVLAARGPDGATVGEIARRAKVAPGTFYNHFDSIDHLIEEIVDELAAGVELGREQLSQIEHDPAARVAIGTRQLLDLASQDASTARAFVTLISTVPGFRSRIRSTVAMAITDGVDQGRFPDRPILLVTDAVIGAVVQWMGTRLVGDPGSAPDDQHLSLVLEMVGLSAADASDVVDRVSGVIAG